MKINFVIIFFLFVIVVIDGTDEDIFDDLWKNVKLSNSKNINKPMFGEINAIKEERIVKNENDEQKNANKVEMEEKKPKLFQTIKKEPFDEKDNNLPTKVKEPKIELEQLSEESFENEFDEQADQNISSADQSNSADDEDYNNMNAETRKENKILNEFNLMKKELRCNYKTMPNVKFEREIAKKLGTNRTEIYKLKRKLGQTRKYTVNKDINKDTMIQTIRKFDEMKKEKIIGFQYDEKKTNFIEREIAKELGITRQKIYQWKKKIDLSKKFSTQQNIEKIEQFEKIKKEFTKKFNLKPNWEIEIKIATKLGIELETIYELKRKFGARKFYSDVEKLEYVKRSEEMKARNPKISERKIAEKLGIERMNLRKWKKKFDIKSNR